MKSRDTYNLQQNLLHRANNFFQGKEAFDLMQRLYDIHLFGTGYDISIMDQWDNVIPENVKNFCV